MVSYPHSRKRTFHLLIQPDISCATDQKFCLSRTFNMSGWRIPYTPCCDALAVR